MASKTHLTSSPNGQLKRQIWMYWNKGLSEAPLLVRLCIESWYQLNPDWDIVVLDDDSLSNFVDMGDLRRRHPLISIQAFCDLLRLRLLNKHGGVWVDATCYCNRPLSEWLPSKVVDGTFFFKTCDTSVFGSWFLYSDGSLLIQRLLDEAERYFFLERRSEYRHFMNMKFIWRGFKRIELSIGVLNYFFWRNKFFLRLTGASPYFWMNYLLGYLVITERTVRSIYWRLSELDERPHDFQIYGLNALQVIPEFLYSDFREGNIPVYKMSCKREVSLWEGNGVLDLLRSRLKVSDDEV